MTTFLHQIFLLCAKHINRWHYPATGSNNTPTVSWAFQEASTVNPVVVDLLRLRLDHNQNAKIPPSVFYHPGPKNTMADDVSRRLDFSNEAFLSFLSSRYSAQSAGYCIFCHPPTSMVASVICALHNLTSAAVTYQKSTPSPSMQTGDPSAPTSALAISLITLTTQWSRYLKCLNIGSRKVVTPRRAVSEQTWFL